MRPAAGFCTLLLSFLALGCGSQPRPAGSTAEDDTRIRQAVDESVAALNASDVESLLDLHASDAVILRPGEEPDIGKEAIRGSFEDLFRRMELEESRTIEDLQVSGGHAFVWGLYTVALRPKDGSAPFSEKGKYIDILERQPDGSWKFARTIWNTTNGE
jgi:uncharacterized protein (TIGR02246 family)